VDSRDRPAIEGVLQLRFVPSLNYVQVLVLRRGGGYDDVEPDSVEVLRRGAVSVEDIEAGEPLISEPGWRRIADLDQARAEGLLPRARVRAGGTWTDMRHRLDGVVAPLVQARQVFREYAEDSWEYGDSVAYDLQRGTERIEVELYEDGPIDVWRLGGEQDDCQGERGTPVLKLDYRDPEEARREAFGWQGWVGGSRPTN
jgi:hypothetical protein